MWHRNSIKDNFTLNLHNCYLLNESPLWPAVTSTSHTICQNNLNEIRKNASAALNSQPAYLGMYPEISAAKRPCRLYVRPVHVFGMKGVAFSLRCSCTQAVIYGHLIREDSVGGRGVLGLAPPRTEIHISLKYGTRVLSATSLQGESSTTLRLKLN